MQRGVLKGILRILMYVGAGLGGLYFVWMGIVWPVGGGGLFQRMSVEFDWEQTKGFKEIKSVLPVFAYPLVPQALPPIASALRKYGWRSAQGDCDVPVLGGVLVLGLDRWVRCYNLIDPELTPLMHAADDGDVAAVEKLLAGRADPNVQDQHGWTALMHASFRHRDNHYVIKALLAAGADSGIKDHQGLTALHWAARNCQPRITAALIEGGADLSKYGQTALYQASYMRCTKVIELLKQRGVRP